MVNLKSMWVGNKITDFWKVFYCWSVFCNQGPQKNLLENIHKAWVSRDSGSAPVSIFFKETILLNIFYFQDEKAHLNYTWSEYE